MGTMGATQLCSTILGLLLFQGYNSQPTTSQGFQEVPQKSSQGSSVSSKPVTLRSSTMDGHSPSLLGLTSSQPEKHTSDLSARTPDSSGSNGSSSSSSSNGSSSSSSSSSSSTGETSLNTPPSSVTMNPRTKEDVTMLPSPTSETVLTVAAFGVISFIVILVVVVIVLVGVVSLRFKCRKNKESEDPQKPGTSGLSESSSTANGEKDRITLVSMKNIVVV